MAASPGADRVGCIALIGPDCPLARRVQASIALDGLDSRLIPPDRLESLAGAGAGTRSDSGSRSGISPDIGTVVVLGEHAGDEPLQDCTGTGLVAAPQILRDLTGLLPGSAVRRLVLLSTALVYGAWPNNPVPITESLALRPEPGLVPAAAAAECERVAKRLADADPELRLAVLRPTIVVSPEAADWLASSPWSARGLLVGDVEPPAQYLHIDDLADAIALVARDRCDGAYNVAPSGWLSAESVRELAGPRPRVLLSAELAAKVGDLRWRFGRTGVPTALAAYTRWPWVVANDRLRALGWSPGFSNEEAFVAISPPGALNSLDASRRQALAMGAVAGGVALAIGAVVWMVRRSQRESRRSN